MGPADLFDFIEASPLEGGTRINDQSETCDENAGPSEDATGYPDAVCALM